MGITPVVLPLSKGEFCQVCPGILEQTAVRIGFLFCCQVAAQSTHHVAGHQHLRAVIAGEHTNSHAGDVAGNGLDLVQILCAYQLCQVEYHLRNLVGTVVVLIQNLDSQLLGAIELLDGQLGSRFIVLVVLFSHGMCRVQIPILKGDGILVHGGSGSRTLCGGRLGGSLRCSCFCGCSLSGCSLSCRLGGGILIVAAAGNSRQHAARQEQRR